MQPNPILANLIALSVTKKFFKKNKRFDDASNNGKIERHKKFKHAKKDKSKLKCHNCGKKGHFTRECTKSK